MPAFSTEVPHALGRDEAIEKLKGFLAQVKEQYATQLGDVDGGWNANVLSFSFTTYGIKIDGSLTAEEDKIKLDGNLPYSAMIFKGKISDSIRVALEKALVS